MTHNGDLTTCMGYYNQDELPVTISTLMERTINDQEPITKEAILHHNEGVDLIPSNLNLAMTEVNLFNAMNRERVLNNSIQELKKDYDYVIIDCMPSLSMLTTNALATADKVIIPVQTQYLSAKGMGNLLKTVSKVKRQINYDLKIGGILLTLADQRTTLPRKIREELEYTYGSIVNIYNTPIPFSVNVAKSTEKGKSIFEFDRLGKVAESYTLFAKEVLEQDAKQRRKNAPSKSYDR